MDNEHSQHRVLDGLRDVTTAMTVRRVFGDPHVVDGVTIVPVARISGGAAAGGGEGTGTDNEHGGGFGSLFGLGVHPVGVYEIRDGRIEWRPSVDVDRLLRGAEMLAAIAVVCWTVIRIRRCRRCGARRS